MPHVFRDFVRGTRLSNDGGTCFIVSYNNRVNGTSPCVGGLYSLGGLRCVNIFRVLVPRGCVTLFNIPRERRTTGVVSNTRPGIYRYTGVVSRGGGFPSRGVNIISGLGDKVMGSIFCGFIVSSGGFTINSGYISYKGYTSLYPLGGVGLASNGPG